MKNNLKQGKKELLNIVSKEKDFTKVTIEVSDKRQAEFKGQHVILGVLESNGFCNMIVSGMNQNGELANMLGQMLHQIYEIDPASIVAGVLALERTINKTIDFDMAREVTKDVATDEDKPIIN